MAQTVEVRLAEGVGVVLGEGLSEGVAVEGAVVVSVEVEAATVGLAEGEAVSVRVALKLGEAVVAGEAVSEGVGDRTGAADAGAT